MFLHSKIRLTDQGNWMYHRPPVVHWGRDRLVRCICCVDARANSEESEKLRTLFFLLSRWKELLITKRWASIRINVRSRRTEFHLEYMDSAKKWKANNVIGESEWIGESCQTIDIKERIESNSGRRNYLDNLSLYIFWRVVHDDDRAFNPGQWGHQSNRPKRPPRRRQSKETKRKSIFGA